MPRPPAPRSLLLVAALLLGGCAVLGGDPEAEAVEVLEAFPPRDRYQALGVVTAKTHGFFYENTLMGRLKAAAAERGANAIVLQGAVRQMRDARGHASQEAAAWAIRWRREE